MGSPGGSGSKAQNGGPTNQRQREQEEEARETKAAMYAPGLFRYLAPRMTQTGGQPPT